MVFCAHFILNTVKMWDRIKGDFKMETVLIIVIAVIAFGVGGVTMWLENGPDRSEKKDGSDDGND